MPNPSPGSSNAVVKLKVRHATTYRYPLTVALSYNQAWLRPLDGFGQTCLQHRLRVDPKPRFMAEQVDLFGNHVHYFEVLSPHETFRIVSEARVAIEPVDYESRGNMPWEQARFRELPPGLMRTRASCFAFATAMTRASPDMVDYARESFKPGRSLRAAGADLCRRLYEDFRYQSGVTQIDTPLQAVWESRTGVCQDFAHLAVAMLRGLGLVACYASGYLLTQPPPGGEKLLGADASHAWFGLMDANGHWLFLDPTNDLWVQAEHITVAIGRDYGDVPPLKGICYGGGAGMPEVAVSVEPLADEEH